MLVNFQKLGLLPYQIDYIQDESQIKIYEKSRQIGITRTQALEDVIDAGVKGLYDVWFSSNSDSNAKEYIRYCKGFAQAFNQVVKDLTDTEVLTQTTTYCIEFTNGCRINAVSSNPEQIHGKNGKIILDEFARRDSEYDVWEAGTPAALVWGRPLRIISTHNGVNSMFNGFIKDYFKGNLTASWKHFKTTIEDAVNLGLADKIKRKDLTDIERKAWIEDLRKTVANSDVWAQQYMCIPQDESSSFISQLLIDNNSKAELLPLDKLKECKSLYGGLDIGRFKNLSILWINEKVSSNRAITRYIRVMDNKDFVEQDRIISQIIRACPNLRRLCIDQTGMGIGLVDFLTASFGENRIEGIHFTATIKETIGFRVKKYLEDTVFDIPLDEVIADDFRSVKQETTSIGKIRLVADTDKETGSHADYFWAAALALEAGNTIYVKPEAKAPTKNMMERFKKSLRGFSKDFDECN